ncbi:MAG: hypothetical protein RI907_3151 [Pseudomonadota bacterium]|jgi:fructose-1,6-bisphosphatase
MSADLPTLREALLANLADVPADQAQALIDTLTCLAQACVDVGAVASRGMLAGAHGLAGGTNSDGDAQKRLDIMADDLIAARLQSCPHVAGWASEEHERQRPSAVHARSGRYLVVYDPLDGSSNIEANISIGTIFSILPHTYRGAEPQDSSYMLPGREQLAAGYVLYGPATMMVLTCKRGVMMFTLDRDVGPGQSPRWVLTQNHVQIPAATREFAINASNQRFWEKPIQRYIAECVAGESGPRMRDFNMRWVASMVAEVHRIMTRGGVFMYPRDTREPRKPGRLRLMYEAAPMSLLVEQAGGKSVNGTSHLLNLAPDTLHQRVPVILGSRDEIDRIVSYHADPHENVSWQLFKTRSLFVQPQA